MPIVERPVATAPLTQGDILKGVPLFITRAAWTEKVVAHQAPFEFCVVVSRPCAIAHKKHVTVAGIAKYPESQPKGIASFDDVLTFITGARDGLTSPDVFYLGHLNELGNGRFCVRLDSLHQLEIPTDPEIVAKFLADKRVATLNTDFARHLHVKLFNAFASMGFDGHKWPSDTDLEWLVTQGRKDIAAQHAAVLQLQADQAAKAAEGNQKGAADDKNLAAAQRKLDEVTNLVRPYEEEMARRSAAKSLPVIASVDPTGG
ncbi:MAG: hypothetical protein U0871_01385 [Gemmataceae bacterium]